MPDRIATQNKPPVCAVVRAGDPIAGKQGFSYAPAISAQTVGAAAIHMQVVTIPPGARSNTHKHREHESAIYVLSGVSAMFYGERLEHHLVAGAGDFVYIPANVPHLTYNVSETEPCLAVIARNDPADQESVELLPELDALRPKGGMADTV